MYRNHAKFLNTSGASCSCPVCSFTIFFFLSFFFGIKQNPILQNTWWTDEVLWYQFKLSPFMVILIAFGWEWTQNVGKHPEKMNAFKIICEWHVTNIKLSFSPLLLFISLYKTVWWYAALLLESVFSHFYGCLNKINFDLIHLYEWLVDLTWTSYCTGIVGVA